MIEETSAVVPRARVLDEFDFAFRAVILAAAFLQAGSLFQDLTQRAYGYTKLVDVDVEASAYTWLSSCIILMNALAALHVAWTRRAAGLSDWTRWTLLGLVLIGLSSEEILALHERVAVRLEPYIDGRIGWSVPALAICALVGLMAIPFLRVLPTATRREMILAGGVYVGGAGGVECIQASSACRRPFR